MESLPAELLEIVFDNLGKEDILNMPTHLISKGLTEAKAQALLRNIYVWLEKNSLARLERIICHPHLARHIHRLTLHDERVKDITARNYLYSYWSTHYRWFKLCPPLHPSFSSYIKMAREQISGDSSVTVNIGKYRMLLKEQQMVEEQQDDVRILSKAFDLLPNLEGVSVDNSNDFRVKKALGDAWCSGLDQDRIAHRGSHIMEVLFKAMSNSVRKISSFEISRNGARIYYRSEFMTMNFPALFTKLPPNTIASATQGLRCLSLRSIYYGLDEVQYHDAARETSCGYSWGRQVHKGEGYDSTKAIAEMLSSASLLEYLTLNCLDIYRERHQKLQLPYFPLHSMRGSNNLQHLQKLSLGHFKTRQDQFVRFLLKVAGTVISIRLNGIALDHGSWLSAFSKLRGRFSRLLSIIVGISRFYDTGLGEDDMGSEEISSSAMARDVKVRIVYCWDYRLLDWLKDGTGSNPGGHWVRR